MAYATNYRNLNNLMEKGEYEFVISDAYEQRPDGGTPYIALLLVVRNDIEQKYQNKAVRVRKYLSEGAMPYTERDMNTISKCVGLAEGVEFGNIDSWGDAVRGRPIRAAVKHREYNGDTYEDISFYKRSDAPECKHVWKDDGGDGMRRFADRKPGGTPQVQAFPKPQIDEDKLPF